jgi:hypothetical protein
MPTTLLAQAANAWAARLAGIAPHAIELHQWRAVQGSALSRKDLAQWQATLKLAVIRYQLAEVAHVVTHLTAKGQ